MVNKNRVSGRNSRGSNKVRLEGEQTMSEQLQSENEQTSIEAEEFQVHEETGQEQLRQDEQFSAQEESTSPEVVANENLNEEPIIQEEQDIVPKQVDGEQRHEDSPQQEVILNEENTQELQQELNDGKEERPLAIEDIVKPGKFGVTNSQMIPAIKQVIADSSVEKLRMLRSMYLYSFENSLRYLKKSEREFIQNNLK
ncbi:hypothetical protein A8L34_11955 [Bacillus sp. FJAT-27264]|uniref:hypothetical protein n=1 Tax=Paenibacillus sp. (strain DSM 101736 / FJAT-27264) TaxID=1850362 RepID=UPI00080805FC|nr:hypothetical protein [Bacillus sp. FJAT-27264]OBZ14629.1 hypothetical protein A8L34_11955 [Bacillus sp. FJAT-27264]